MPNDLRGGTLLGSHEGDTFFCKCLSLKPLYSGDFRVQVATCKYSTGKMPTKLLNDGYRIPVVGLGTAIDQQNRNQLRQALIWGIEAGFRFIDTAALYATEDIIGQAIIDVTSRGIVERKDLFILTKLDFRVNTHHGVVPSLKLALKRLQLDYIDMFLIHAPFSPLGDENFDYLDIWKGMEEAKQLSLTKSIGVSNFNSSDINKVLTYGYIRPAVNELELNPSFTNLDLVAYCQSEGIEVIAYSPFGYLVPRTNRAVIPPPTFEDPLLVNIAKKNNKTTSQVALRYLIDRGVIPIPGSINKHHLQLNMDIFDFSLTRQEIYMINEFNVNIPVRFTPEESLAAIRYQIEWMHSLNQC